MSIESDAFCHGVIVVFGIIGHSDEGLCPWKWC